MCDFKIFTTHEGFDTEESGHQRQKTTRNEEVCGLAEDLTHVVF